MYSLSILDNSNEDPASSVRFTVIDLATGNFTAWNAALDALQTAINGITLGTLATERRVADDKFLSRVRPSSKEAQREKKWLVRYEDTVTHKIYRNEIPTADLSLLTSGSDTIASFPVGPLADFKTAFEAAVLSPAKNTVTLLTLEYVGKRL
jgi:hypothetical protein